MTNYGKIDVLWYDGVPVSKHGKAWTSEKLYTIPRTLQPDIIINDRVYSFGHKGDFTCSECSIGGSDRPWESCYTIDDTCWGYHPGDPHLKSPMDLVRLLVRCVAGNGNFTLNVGPKADGVIPATQARRVKAVGKWLKHNGESIYGAGSTPFYLYAPGQITAKDNTLYIHVLYWPGKELCLAGIKNKIHKIRILATDQELPFEQNNDRLFVRNLPKRPPDPIDTVLALEYEGKLEAEVDEWWKLNPWWLKQ
jgi:alpha-L-fucosidase